MELESNRGEARWLGAAHRSSLLPSSLIEPDVRISRIRLSDQLHSRTHDLKSSSCRKSLLESVWRFVVLLGSSPIASPRLLRKRARSEDPSLHRHYPASTVLWPPPTSGPSASLRDVRVAIPTDRISPVAHEPFSGMLLPLPRWTGRVHLSILPHPLEPSPS